MRIIKIAQIKEKMPGSKSLSGHLVNIPGYGFLKPLKVQIYEKKQKSHPFWGMALNYLPGISLSHEK